MSYTAENRRTAFILTGILIGMLVIAPSMSPAWGQDAAKAKGIAVAKLTRDKPVDFQTEILPFLKQSCLACHNSTKAKAKLVLESPQSIAKGSESGKVIIPGKADQSLLLISSAHRDDPIMPPKGNKVNAPNLTSEQLGLLKLWIDQGAKGDMKAAGLPLEWQELPKGLNPIMSVAVSSDGQYVACGRANQIFIYHLPSKSLFTRLTDPALIKAGLYKKRGVAHRDMVQSLAFSPDGSILASGGYRVAKLWQRPRHTQQFKLQAGDAKAPVKNQPLVLQAVTVSPDGKWLATGASDNTIHIANAQTGKVEKKLTGHTGTISALRFSPDSQKLYSGAADKTLRVWTIADGKQFASATTALGVNAVTWIAGPGHIASGADDNIVRLWKLPEKAGGALSEVKQMAGHTMAVSSLDTFTKDGKQILSGSHDGTARIWNVDNGQQVRQFAFGAPATAVAARPDSQRVAVGGMNNTAVLFNATNAQKIKDLTGDRYANERVAHLTAQEKFTTAQVTRWDQAFTKAQDAQKKAADALIKATDEKAPKFKAYADKGKPYTDAVTALAAVKREVAKSNLLVASATEVKLRSDQAATQVAASIKTVAQAATRAKSTYDKFNGDLTKKTSAANQAKAQRDKLKTDFANKTKAVATAKAAATKAKADYDAKQKLATDSKAAAAKAKANYDAKQKLATDASAAATKAKADYDAKQKLANDTKVASDKAAQEAAAAQKAADEAKKGDDKNAAEQKAKLAAEAKAKADKLAADAKVKADEAAKAKSASDTAAKDAKAKVTAATAAKAASDTAANEAKTKAAAATASKTASDKAAAAVVTSQKAADTAKAQLAKAEADYTAKQKLVAAAKPAVDKAKAAYDAKQKVAAAAQAKQKAAEAARNTANQQLKAAQNTQKQANDKLKAADKKVKDLQKEYDKVKGERDAAENKFHQASLALRNAVRNLLEIRDNRSRAKRQQQMARDDLADAVKAVDQSLRPIRTLAFSPDNRLLAIAGDAQTIHTYSADSGQAYETFAGHEKPVTALAFAPQGKVVSRSSDATVIAWDLNAAWKIHRMLGSGDQSSPIVHRALALAFSPDGEYLAVGGGDPSRTGQINIWRATDGRFIREFAEPHSDTVFDLEFSADSRFIASASADRFAKIFYASDGKLYKSFEGHTHHVLGVSWNRNGQVITTVGADKGVKVWNAITGERKKDFSNFKKEVTSVQYVGYTDQVLLSSGDSQVRISREAGNNVRSFSGASKFVYAADVTPDGKVVAAGGEDGVLRIWNGTNGKVIATFEAPKPEQKKAAAAK